MALNLQSYNPNQIAESVAVELRNQALRQTIADAQADEVRKAAAFEQARADEPLRKALQMLELRKRGIFVAPRGPLGAPAALPAIPLSPGRRTVFESAPENAPLNPEVTEPTFAPPVQLAENIVYDPITERNVISEQISQALRQKQAESDIQQQRQITVAGEQAKLQRETEAARPVKPVKPLAPQTFDAGGKKWIFDPETKSTQALIGPDGEQLVTSAATPSTKSEIKELGGKMWKFNPDTQELTPLLDPNGRQFLAAPKEGKTGGAAKPLPKAIAERISDAQSAVDNLIVLKSYLDDPDVQKISGPLAGRTVGINPFSPTVGNFQGARGTAKQIIGKYMEGGVLRAEDEKKYEKIIPSITMLPAVQQTQAKRLYETLKKKLERDLDAYEKSGYDVEALRETMNGLDQSFGIAPSESPTAPGIPTFETEAEARDANLPNGTPVIIGGEKGIWEKE